MNKFALSTVINKIDEVVKERYSITEYQNNLIINDYDYCINCDNYIVEIENNSITTYIRISDKIHITLFRNVYKVLIQFF